MVFMQIFASNFPLTVAKFLVIRRGVDIKILIEVKLFSMEVTNGGCLH
jgi:hypothetical protein